MAWRQGITNLKGWQNRVLARSRIFSNRWWEHIRAAFQMETFVGSPTSHTHIPDKQPVCIWVQSLGNCGPDDKWGRMLTAASVQSRKTTDNVEDQGVNGGVLRHRDTVQLLTSGGKNKKMQRILYIIYVIMLLSLSVWHRSQGPLTSSGGREWKEGCEEGLTLFLKNWCRNSSVNSCHLGVLGR